MNTNGTVQKAVNESILQQSLDDSVQHFNQDSGGYAILRWLGDANSIVPPWWSKERDLRLRSFWKSGDHIAGAVYSVTTRIETLPFQILPKDESIRSHVRQADQVETMLQQYSDFGQGWQQCMSKFIQDYLTLDNGAFLEVIGAGQPDGPIQGLPVGIAHLDSWRCTRTSDPEFPVIFQDVDGKRYKFHYSRVIYRSQLPSPDRQMYGVGFCAVSRAIYNAQNLIDMAVYKQEKMGSRPPRQMLVGSNISAQKILEAFVLANTQMDNQGLGRFSKTVVIGRGDGDAKVDQIDLAGVPDGFDEETATTLAMFSIALAFGVDARELWPASSSGATKADAMVQHLKARGKGLGEIQKMITQEINHKVLPPHLEIYFDAQDDEEDQVQTEIQDKRADTRSKNLNAGTITIRVARLQMLENGEISQEQFEDMELEDGRLEDGTNILALFQTPDSDMQMLLALPGIADPLDLEANDAATMEQLITKRVKFLQNRLFVAPNGRMKQMAQMAIAALDALSDLYRGEVEEVQVEESEPESMPATDGNDEPVDEQVQDIPTDDEELKKNVTISPDGSDKPLPSQSIEIPFTDRDIEKAIQSFEDEFPELGDLLDAEVVNKPAKSLLDYLTLAKSLRWEYDDTVKRYRDRNTGRFLSPERIIRVRDQYQTARQQIGVDLAGQLANGDITIQRWVADMRQSVKETYIAEYMLARGGRHNMTQSDWGRLGNMLRNQYGYLDRFAQEIAAGNLSQAQIAARAKMYFASATQAFERAQAAGRGIQLSQYPCSGQTQCMSQCKCSLRFEEKETTWEITWRLGVAEHCDDCVALASSWNPLVVPK